MNGVQHQVTHRLAALVLLLRGHGRGQWLSHELQITVTD